MALVLVFAMAGSGMGLGLILLYHSHGGFKEMAADRNRYVCLIEESVGEGNTLTRRMWKRFGFKFFDLYLASLLNYNLWEHIMHILLESPRAI